MNWYDTEQGIEKALDKGLAGLRELFDARHSAYYGREERLHAWCVLGRYQLDSCGNSMIICVGAPADHPSHELHGRIRRVMPFDEAHKLCGTRMVSEIFRLPLVTSVCDRCLDDWKMENAHDVHWARSHVGTEYDAPRHCACQRLVVFENADRELRALLAEAGLVGEVRLVPNRYWGPIDEHDFFPEPWAIIETCRGPIRIGWRKRVISIDWGFASSSIEADGNQVVGGDDVTASDRMCHAWGIDKAIVYLRRLWELSTPQGDASP